MTLETNLAGRLRNTSLPKSSGLLPLFEAVVNSIHAIEDARLKTAAGRIDIEIDRSDQSGLFDDQGPPQQARSERPIVEISILDNGTGFNDANMQSFQTLDSDYKADRGGRGVGRLMWLKAFRSVRIESRFFDDDGVLLERRFEFDAEDSISNEELGKSWSESRETKVTLVGFEDQYRDNAPKTAPAIARSILEHCLWYFVRHGGAPKIRIHDGESVEDLGEIFDELMHSNAATETRKVKGQEFTFTHVKLRARSSRKHELVYCASRRAVKHESLNQRIPGLYGPLSDEDGEFTYACYVESDALDSSVRAERTEFDLPQRSAPLFDNTDLSLADIRKVAHECIRDHLNEHLERNLARGHERVEDFVSKKAPRYRPILKHIPEGRLAVDPEISDKDLELLLHSELADVENQLLAEGQSVLTPREDEENDEYRERLDDYLQKAEDIKKSDLASYVSHRRVVIDLFARAIQQDEHGNYAREDLIHRLIMPLKTDSTEAHPDACNLWLIDERLAFHNYMASDTDLSSIPITGSTSKKRPDIVSLRDLFDTPHLVSHESNLPLASIVVVEIKRPLRNDAAAGEEKDPVEQALGYLERIRNGKAKTATGRPIPESNEIPGYCYVLCDLTPSVIQRCRMHHMIRTQDGLGFFVYHPNYKAYVEVWSFDGLLKGAKERNQAFFDRLGLPSG